MEWQVNPVNKKATVVLIGNPNCGKTTVFNALTGLRAKVANYPGVTVEKKEGRLLNSPDDLDITILDLPGVYSLTPKTLDEKIAVDVLFNRVKGVPAVDLVLVIVDATILERNLYLLTQVIETGLPIIVILTMVDLAEEQEIKINIQKLSEILSVDIIPVIASRKIGIDKVSEKIVEMIRHPRVPEQRSFIKLPEIFENELNGLCEKLKTEYSLTHQMARTLSLLLLVREYDEHDSILKLSANIIDALKKAKCRLESAKVDYAGLPVKLRYQAISEICKSTVSIPKHVKESTTDWLDSILLHKFWGIIIFFFVMALMFNLVFVFARPVSDFLTSFISNFGNFVGGMLPAGAIQSLVRDGFVTGIGAIIVYLPQICLLFLFLGLMEDSGYLARVAVVMDKFMSKIGLHGKSFIPFLTSFGCAIPGILACRTIESRLERMVVILSLPFISCSARLPVFTLLIAATIPDKVYFGIFKLQGLVLGVMYFTGIVATICAAWILKKLVFKGELPELILELPQYRKPSMYSIFIYVWDRAFVFLKRAGGLILAVNIILWALINYPKNSDVSNLDQLSNEQKFNVSRLENSYAARLGRAIEPVIAPLGFDWRIGVGLVTSFVARESFISTMTTIYSSELGSADLAKIQPAKLLQTQRRPDGTVFFTPLVGIVLMLFYVFAMQCAGTLVVVWSETGSWIWPILQWFTMTGVAWLVAFLTYRIGIMLGF